MSSFGIGWSGQLFDKNMQDEFISCLLPIAKAYEEKYFGKFKDSTTLEIFNNRLVKGNILIDRSLLNIPEEEKEKVGLSRLIDVSSITRFLNDEKPGYEEDIQKFFICKKVILNGLQFKINTGPHEGVKDKKYFSKVSFVFAQFDSESDHSLLLRNNIVEVCDKKSIKRRYKHFDSFNLLLYPSGFSYRYCNMSFLVSLCNFAKHYFIKNLDNGSFHAGGDLVKEYLLKHDPEAKSEEVKKEVLDYLVHITGELAEKGYK